MNPHRKKAGRRAEEKSGPGGLPAQKRAGRRENKTLPVRRPGPERAAEALPGCGSENAAHPGDQQT